MSGSVGRRAIVLHGARTRMVATGHTRAPAPASPAERCLFMPHDTERCWWSLGGCPASFVAAAAAVAARPCALARHMHKSCAARLACVSRRRHGQRAPDTGFPTSSEIAPVARRVGAAIFLVVTDGNIIDPTHCAAFLMRPLLGLDAV